jgi:hypothetical protein
MTERLRSERRQGSSTAARRALGRASLTASSLRLHISLMRELLLPHFMNKKCVTYVSEHLLPMCGVHTESGGVAEHLRKWRASSSAAKTGWFPRRYLSRLILKHFDPGTTPSAALRSWRAIFLLPQPPLLTEERTPASSSSLQPETPKTPPLCTIFPSTIVSTDRTFLMSASGTAK